MGRHAGAIRCDDAQSTRVEKQQQHRRELTHFRGDPDPFKGDVPNQRVRDQAKDTLDVLFSAQEPPTYTAQAASNTKGRIQGFGSTPSEPPAANTNVSYGTSSAGMSYAGGASSAYGAGGAPSSSSKYVGFGNPMMEGTKQAPQPTAAAVANATLDMAKQWVTTAGQAVGLAAAKVGVAGTSGRSMLGTEVSVVGGDLIAWPSTWAVALGACFGDCSPHFSHVHTQQQYPISWSSHCTFLASTFCQLSMLHALRLRARRATLLRPAAGTVATEATPLPAAVASRCPWAPSQPMGSPAPRQPLGPMRRGWWTASAGRGGCVRSLRSRI